MYIKHTPSFEDKKFTKSNSTFPFETFSTLLQWRALEHPHQRAYTFLVDGEAEEVHISYGELDLQAKMIAASLQTHASLGDRALLLYPSGLEFISAFFGCLYAGIIAVPVYPPRRNQKLTRLQKIVSDAQATLVLTTQGTFSSIQKQLEQVPELEKLIWLITDELSNSSDLDWQEPRSTPYSLAFLQYTSGSTGNPKGVMVSHKNLLHNSEYIKTAFQLTSTSISVSWLPVFHDMGLIDGILQPLYTGFHGVFMSPEAFVSKPLRWLEAISRYKATHCGGPNFGYEFCLEKIDSQQKARLDLSSWKTAYNGAEPIRSQTLKRFSEAFASCGFEPQFFYPCYGMAETTLMVSGGPVESQPTYLSLQTNALEKKRIIVAENNSQNSQELVGCGRTWLDTKIVIVDPDSLKQVPPDVVGEIWISGSSIAQGYWNQPEETQKTFHAYLADTGEGPFLRTGDLGFLRDEELFITGRIKDLIIIRGRNHYPQDLELSVEQSHIALRPNSGAAFTVKVDGKEELVIVQEVQREHLRKIDVDEVSGYIRRAITQEHELQVYDVILIKTMSLPKTSSGKIQRSVCKQKYLNNELDVLRGKTQPNQNQQQPETQSKTETLKIDTLGLLETWMKQWIAHKANITHQEIPSAAQFVEYGLDSVLAIEFANEVEKVLGIRLANGTIFVYPTIQQLSQYILERLGDKDTQKLLVNLEKIGHSDSTQIEKNEVFELLAQFSSLEDISPDYYQFDLLPEYLKYKAQFSIYESGELEYPYFKAKQKAAKSTILIDDHELIDFSSFDYLRLSSEPNVIKAAQSAIEQYGTSAGASRIVSGECPLHIELEKTIASLLGTEDAVVFGHGHATNVYGISSLVGPKDLIVHDKYMHNSGVMGGQLSGATMIPFAHNDLQALEKILEEKRLHYQRVLILVEGVYSMDGDVLADLPKLIEIKNRYKAWLFIDEAHSIGVLGQTGRGVGEYFGINPHEVDIWMGTISKALGSSGGYIAGCQALITYLKHTSPGFLFTVGASPANIAAGLASIRQLQANPQRVTQLHNRAKLFLELAKEHQLNTGTSHDSGVVPIIVGDSNRAEKLADAARRRGINVFAMGYPAVEFNEARLRFFISALHTEEQIKYTVNTIAELLENI